MRIERNRYAYPRRLFGPRAVVVDDHGLTVEHWLGIRSTTPWTRVCGVRHARHGRAEVELVDGRRLALPGTGERLEALIDAIGSECVEAQAEARERAARPSDIAVWLGIPPTGSIEDDPKRIWRWAAPPVMLIGTALAVKAIDHRVVLGLAAGLAVPVACWAELLGAVTVDVRGVTWRSRLGCWTVRWADVLEARYGYTDKDRGIILSLTTRERTYTVRGPMSSFLRVGETAEKVAAANTAHFAGDDGGVPDTALSLARLETAETGRSLSLAEPRGD